MPFSSLCRSNSGSYDFGAMETFNQHAKIYQYAEFHQKRTVAEGPIIGIWERLYGKCPRAILMKIDILIDPCMLIKSLNGPKVVGPTV